MVSMTGSRLYVQEAATLAPKREDGSYPVVIITEGEGSSGRYSRELLERSEHVFAGAASFLNHPIDPAKPHLRPVESIAGRMGATRLGEDKGKRAILSDFKPRKEYAEFVEEFQDILALSIYCAADGEVMEDGRLDVREFDALDPYRSVDIVVAAGRGGRFAVAQESLRVIESSLGIPEGNQPGVTSAPGSQKEGSMEIKELVSAVEALTKSLEPVVTFVTEQKAAAEAAVTAAEAQAKAAADEKDAAIESYSAAVKAVSEAELLPSQEADILAAAKAGKDIAPLVESAKKVLEEARNGAEGKRHVIESASGGSNAYDYSLNLGGRR